MDVAVSPFVGRLREVRLLLDSLAARTSGCVIVGGEAGVGKSRLLDEFRRQSAKRAAFVTGTCLEYAPSAFHPLRELASKVSAAYPKATPRALRLLAESTRRLANERDADEPGERDADRKLETFESVARALREYASLQPLIAVVEDVQWADGASLELLQHLTSSLGDAPVLIVVTHRTEGPEQAGVVRPFLRRMSRLPNVVRVSIDRLDDAEIDEILVALTGSRLDRRQRSEVCRRAEGNPLFAEELAKHVLDPIGARTSSVLPPTVADAVVSRLRGFAPRERAILMHAAVLGRRFDFTVLAQLVDDPIDDVLGALRAAREVTMVVEEEPPFFSFHHALVQEAVAGELLAVEARAIHARAVDVLERLPPDPGRTSELAYHAWAARRAATAVVYNERAGDAAASAGAALEAAQFFERALDACDDEHRTSELDHKLGRALANAGFPDRALRAFRQALELDERNGERESVASACLAIADQLAILGDEETGLAYLAQARDALEDSVTGEAFVRTMLYSAELDLWDGDLVAGTERLARVADVIVDAGDELRARYHALEADRALLSRDYEAAISAQGRAVEAAHANPRLELEHRGRLGEVLTLCAELERAAVVFGDAATRALELSDVARNALYRMNRAEVMMMRGKFADPRAELEAALSASLRTDNPALILQTGRNGIFLAQRFGDRALADRVVRTLELEERFRYATDRALFPLSGAYASWLLWHERRDEAMEVLARAVARLRRKRLRATDWSLCTLMTVVAVGSLDDVPTIRDFLSGGSPANAPAFISLIDAMAAARAGRVEDAQAAALVAAARFERIEMVFEEAIAWEIAGEPERAIECFTRAGSEPDVERLKRSLIPVNRRGRASDTLTEREMQIAERIAAGDSNRAIANTLSISEKTVETHVASIFGRLSVRSRREIARWYEERSNEAIEA